MMARASTGAMDAAAVDEVLRRLVEGGRGGRQVQLSEAEIRQLCVEAKQVLLAQPNLLRIHAPVKICGERPRRPLPAFAAPLVSACAPRSRFDRRAPLNFTIWVGF
jgi:hypothetical protein